MKDNIVLIGMPGVGKSSAGIVLAKKLGYEFVDSDIVIQKEQGMLLKDIIAREGHDGFLRIEDSINSEIDVHRTVIATGGSAVYGGRAMKHFEEIGTIVYMRASYDTISSRLSDLNDRGVAINPGQTLLDLYNERTVLYEKYSEVTVDIDDLTIEQTIHKIAVFFI